MFYSIRKNYAKVVYFFDIQKFFKTGKTLLPPSKAKCFLYLVTLQTKEYLHLPLHTDENASPLLLYL